MWRRVKSGTCAQRTGPYRLKEWRSNEYIIYEANQDFILVHLPFRMWWSNFLQATTCACLKR